MVSLMVYINKILSSCGYPVHFEDVERNENGAVEIHDINLVYDLPVSRKDYLGTTKFISLEINIWGKKNQTIEIEDIIECIDSKLINESFSCNGKLYLFDRDMVYRNNVKDTDINIRRVKLNYIVRIL